LGSPPLDTTHIIEEGASNTKVVPSGGLRPDLPDHRHVAPKFPGKGRAVPKISQLFATYRLAQT
jgi:hypothetical protein